MDQEAHWEVGNNKVPNMDHALFMVVWLVRRCVILLILGSADPCGLDTVATATRRDQTTYAPCNMRVSTILLLLDVIHIHTHILNLLWFVVSGPPPGDASLYYVRLRPLAALSQ